MVNSKGKNIDITYLGYESEFEPPAPLPFGAHKYIRVDGDRIPNKGRIISTTFTCALIEDGVQGEPFSYTRIW